MTKADIRKAYLAKRSTLSDREVVVFQDLLLIRFQSLALPTLDTVHGYLPIEGKHEPDPDTILRWLAFVNPGLRVAVPRSDFATGTMTHWLLEDDTRIVVNAKGIPEPEGAEPIGADEIDLVLLPLLAFDERGYRVGYGKGFYDRFLAECRPDTLRVGLSFFGPVENIADTDTFDMPMDYCVTPDRIYEF
jgi:5-formyltetrahydrofolate cyclo-ligase